MWILCICELIKEKIKREHSVKSSSADHSQRCRCIQVIRELVNQTTKLVTYFQKKYFNPFEIHTDTETNTEKDRSKFTRVNGSCLFDIGDSRI